MRDQKWETWTCTLGWPVQGIWPAGADGTDINSCAMSHTKDLIVSGDDFGHNDNYKSIIVVTQIL